MYICFVDLEKAFDSVPREALCVELEKLGCSRKFVRLLTLLLDKVECCMAVETKSLPSLPSLVESSSDMF